LLFTDRGGGAEQVPEVVECCRINGTAEFLPSQDFALWVISESAMAKIYVSSTYLDLQEHRTQVEKVIRRMGHEDVAMEYYVAEDTRPVAKCLADVATCDVYVGIFAWRMGTPAKGYDTSITELEFREAEKHSKPCLIFLLSDDAPWPRKFIDKDATKIENFRDAARTNHTADYFITSDELARKVAEAIHKWEKEHGLIPVAAAIPEYNLEAYY
jgi:hypothetical protein